MTLAYLRKPTKADADRIRAAAKSLGYRVRVARMRMSLRIIGNRDQVIRLASLCQLAAAGGEPLHKHAFPDESDLLGPGMTQFFGYVRGAA